MKRSVFAIILAILFSILWSLCFIDRLIIQKPKQQLMWKAGRFNGLGYQDTAQPGWLLLKASCWTCAIAPCCWEDIRRDTRFDTPFINGAMLDTLLFCNQRTCKLFRFCRAVTSAINPVKALRSWSLNWSSSLKLVNSGSRFPVEKWFTSAV